MLSIQQGKIGIDHLQDLDQGPTRQVEIKVHQVIQLIQVQQFQLQGRIREGVKKLVLFGIT